MSSAEQKSLEQSPSQVVPSTPDSEPLPQVSPEPLKAPPARPKLVAPLPRPTLPSQSKPELNSHRPQSPRPSRPDSALAIPVEPDQAASLDPAMYRYLPIAPPSEPMQYRAIGLVRGTYSPMVADELNRGNLITEQGDTIDAVLLGRVTSLVKKHLDLNLPHLWVVYPRTRQREDAPADLDLHLQIVGVWEPETLGLPGETPATDQDDQSLPPEDRLSKGPGADLPAIDENFFSIRGEVIKYSPEEQAITVKILQGIKRSPGVPKPFKLNLQGTIEGRTVGYFWDFKVKREGKILFAQQAAVVGIVPPKKRSSSGRQGPRRKPPTDQVPSQPLVKPDIARPKKVVLDS
ncbi:MAG: hypothetical protein KGQ93_09850 [Cyanobacteria bacterium REEB459]|nr:hypothetical protein [Cyanobacteria bacterium REEB459]